jgi:hypothetical protein
MSQKWTRTIILIILNHYNESKTHDRNKIKIVKYIIMQMNGIL